MNYKKILERLGLVENKDFELTESGFEMLEQTRQVPSEIVHHEAIEATYDVIHHEAIEATYETIYHDITPSVLDEEGNEIEPAIPAWEEEVEVTPFIEAWDEQVILTPPMGAWDEQLFEPELFTLDAPSEEVIEQTWKEVQLSESDIVFIIEEYLKDKTELRTNDDDFSIKNGIIERWGFKNIAQPSNDELLALMPVANAVLLAQTTRNQMATIGKRVQEVCDNCLNIIVGFNVTRQLSAQQITQITEDFAPIMKDLMDRRPWSAKLKIQAIQPDGQLIQQAMVDMVLAELSGF